MREGHLWFGWVVAVALTLGAVAADPYIVEGHELLGDPSTWVARTVGEATVAEGPVLRTGADCEPECRAVAAGQLTFPEGPGWVLEGQPRLVSPGERARLFVLTTDPDGVQRWYGSRRAGLSSPRVLRVEVPPEAAGSRADAGAILIGADGELDVGPLSLRAARPSQLHGALWWAAAGTWGAVGALALATLFRGSSGRMRLALVGLLALTLLGILAPRGPLDDLLLGLPGLRPQDVGPLQKWVGHVGGFALLGLLAGTAGSSPAVALARIAAFAGATEALQLLSASRSGSGVDLIRDLAGAGVGLAIAWALHREKR